MNSKLEFYRKMLKRLDKCNLTPGFDATLRMKYENKVMELQLEGCLVMKDEGFEMPVRRANVMQDDCRISGRRRLSMPEGFNHKRKSSAARRGIQRARS